MYFAKDSNGILFKVRDDGSTRQTTYDDPCYIEWLSNGETFGELHISVEYTPTDEQLASDIRAKRNNLIAETDYLLMSDYPLTEEKKACVLAYRQALRDITLQETFPQNVTWPVLE